MHFKALRKVLLLPGDQAETSCKLRSGLSMHAADGLIKPLRMLFPTDCEYGIIIIQLSAWKWFSSPEHDDISLSH